MPFTPVHSWEGVFPTHSSQALRSRLCQSSPGYREGLCSWCITLGKTAQAPTASSCQPGQAEAPGYKRGTASPKPGCRALTHHLPVPPQSTPPRPGAVSGKTVIAQSQGAARMSRPAAVTTSTCQSRVQLSTGIQGAQVGSQHHNIPPILWEGRGRPLHPEKVSPRSHARPQPVLGGA